jgi:glycosyltransferase involved in cell wall biosynthesis
MKILHVWNTAGIACILAKYQRRVGHTANVITRSGYDSFGIAQFYGATQFDDMGSMEFALMVVNFAGRYDVIHIHSLPRLAFFIRMRYPRKKIILHYHGSELRNGSSLFEACASHVIVCTRDLLPLVKHENALYIPNPIDIEHFRPLSNTGAKWLSFMHSGQFSTEPPSCIDAVIVDRGESAIRYAQMPAYLSQFAGYVDVKIVNGQKLQAMSTTGLQALACGLPVYNYECRVLRGLPQEHKPENVVKQVMALYE